MEPVPERCRRKGSPFALADANESHRTATASGTSAFGLALAAAVLTAACSTLTVDPFPEPIRPPKEDPETAATTEATAPGEEEAGQRGLTKSNIPGVVIQRTVAEGIIEQFGQDLTGDPIKVSFHEIPLVAFIDAVFGEQLNMSFVVSPGLQDKKDLVTLRLTEPLPPAELFLWARRALSTYGVDVSGGGRRPHLLRERRDRLPGHPAPDHGQGAGGSARHPPHDLPVGAAAHRESGFRERLAQAGVQGTGHRDRLWNPGAPRCSCRAAPMSSPAPST